MRLHKIDPALEQAMNQASGEKDFMVTVNLHHGTSTLFFPALTTMGLTIEKVGNNFFVSGPVSVNNIRLLEGLEVVTMINLQSKPKPEPRWKKRKGLNRGKD